MRILYLPEPFLAPVVPLLISEDDPSLVYLNDNLKPVKCYNRDRDSVACPDNLMLKEGETYVVGGASAEVLASYLDLPFIDERRVRIQEEYVSGDIYSFFKAIQPVLKTPYEEPVIKNSAMVIFPGSILNKRAWGIAYIAQLEDSNPRIKAEIIFDQNFRVLHERISDFEVFHRFENWWQPPWEYIFAYGKNFRRIMEIVSERPVEKIPLEILKGAKIGNVEDILDKIFSSTSREGFEVSGRRSLKKAVVYIDDNLIKPSKTYTAVVIIKNSQRKIFARWYFDERMQLKGFDNVPPEAISGVDAELAVGLVPRETQTRLSQALASFLVKKGLLTPVRLVDYLAIKTHRWYEIAAL